MNTFESKEQYLADKLRRFANEHIDQYASPGDVEPAILAVLTVATQREAKSQGINLVITYVGGSDEME